MSGAGRIRAVFLLLNIAAIVFILAAYLVPPGRSLWRGVSSVRQMSRNYSQMRQFYDEYEANLQELHAISRRQVVFGQNELIFHLDEISRLHYTAGLEKSVFAAARAVGYDTLTDRFYDKRVRAEYFGRPRNMLYFLQGLSEMPAKIRSFSIYFNPAAYPAMGLRLDFSLIMSK